MCKNGKCDTKGHPMTWGANVATGRVGERENLNVDLEKQEVCLIYW